MKHLLGLKWQLVLNSGFVCQISAGEYKNKKVIKVQILTFHTSS